MHRMIRDHLEQVLADSHASESDSPVAAHIQECEECRGELEAMLEQARLLRELRAEAEPRPGFYARVMERIERQGPGSIWSVFSESAFGRRIAVASMALALLAGVYLYTSEQSASNPTVEFVAGALPGEDQPALVMAPSGVPDRDTVLVNLVTYREQ